MSATQIKPAIVTWTRERGCHGMVRVFGMDGALPPDNVLALRFGHGFYTRQEVADGLRRMAELIEGPQGLAGLPTETLGIAPPSPPTELSLMVKASLKPGPTS